MTRILFSTREPRPDDNPYLLQLFEGLSDAGLDIDFLRTRTTLRGRPDVFHVHWPHQLTRADGLLKSIVKSLLTTVMLTRFALRRVPVVATVHNLASHEREHGWEKMLFRWLDRLTVARIYLNASDPSPRDGVIILHSDYRAWLKHQGIPLDDLRTRMPSRDAILFGMLRPYKGIEALAFAAREADCSLTVAGKPLDTAYGAHLAAELDTLGAHLVPRHLDDPELAALIADHALVCLPYPRMYNSGALLYALSLGRPVLVPRSPANEAIANEVGDQWVRIYDGALTPEVLADAATASRAVIASSSAPDLSHRTWPEAVAAHASFYEAVVSAGSS